MSKSLLKIWRCDQTLYRYLVGKFLHIKRDWEQPLPCRISLSVAISTSRVLLCHRIQYFVKVFSVSQSLSLPPPLPGHMTNWSGDLCWPMTGTGVIVDMWLPPIQKCAKVIKPMTCDTWHVIRGTRQVTRDTWHVTCCGGWTFFQNFSSLALMAWEWRCTEDISTNHQSVS